MEKTRLYRIFFKSLRRLIDRVPSRRAPANLADRVMNRLACGDRPRWEFDLVPTALSCAAVVAACFILLFDAGGRRLAVPHVESFAADRLQVEKGESITLTWKVLNAKKVMIKAGRSTVIDPRPAGSISMKLLEPGAHRFQLIALADGKSLQETLESLP